MIISRRFYSVLFLLLWFAAVNHCGIEALVGAFSGSPITSQDFGGCGSHSDGDPSSHTEGVPCELGPMVQPVEKGQVAFQVSALNADMFSLLLSGAISQGNRIVIRPGTLEPFFGPKESLASLTIASNAPPSLLV